MLSQFVFQAFHILVATNDFDFETRIIFNPFGHDIVLEEGIFADFPTKQLQLRPQFFVLAPCRRTR